MTRPTKQRLWERPRHRAALQIRKQCASDVQWRVSDDVLLSDDVLQPGTMQVIARIVGTLHQRVES